MAYQSKGICFAPRINYYFFSSAEASRLLTYPVRIATAAGSDHRFYKLADRLGEIVRATTWNQARGIDPLERGI
jgi:hypothetical protein